MSWRVAEHFQKMAPLTARMQVQGFGESPSILNAGSAMLSSFTGSVVIQSIF